MEAYVTTFFKTELTFIPRILKKYLGSYYNNTACNGAFWMLSFWSILHIVFDKFFNIFLTKMKYKTHIRQSLSQSLWYLGFYFTAFIYCSVTMNNVFELNNSGSIIGYIMIITFYLQSALWEGLKMLQCNTSCRYFLLFLLMSSAHIFGVDFSCKLTLLIASAQVPLELLKCFVLAKHATNSALVWFAGTVSLFVAVYLVLVPVLIVYPLALNFTKGTTLILPILVVWLGFEVYGSVFLKWVWHFAHKETCNVGVFDCCLLGPRNDFAYNFHLLRNEMLERQEKLIGQRKPKGRNAVFQTLKCMVAIKRKLVQRRQTEDESPTNDKVKEE